jgi:hypothetical protein
MDLDSDFDDAYFAKRVFTQKQRTEMHRLDYRWIRAKLGKNGHKRFSILDIGCSDGSFLSQFPTSEFELFGIEPNKREAEKCKEKAIIILEALSSYKDFDIVIIRGTLHHLPDSQGFIKTLCLSFSESSTSSNKFFFALANPNCESLLYRKFSMLPALEKEPTFDSLFKVWGGKELANLLESNGAQVDLSYPYFRTPYKNLLSDPANVLISLMSKTYRDVAFPRNMFNLAAKFAVNEST